MIHAWNFLPPGTQSLCGQPQNIWKENEDNLVPQVETEPTTVWITVRRYAAALRFVDKILSEFSYKNSI